VIRVRGRRQERYGQRVHFVGELDRLLCEQHRFVRELLDVPVRWLSEDQFGRAVPAGLAGQVGLRREKRLDVDLVALQPVPPILG
jgi:hypothetical protein